jgi:hypothetical protein
VRRCQLSLGAGEGEQAVDQARQPAHLGDGALEVVVGRGADLGFEVFEAQA